LILRESVNKGREARFMLLIVEPGFVPSLERQFHRKIKKATIRVRLKSYTTDDLSVISVRLIFQEEIAFE
jgi:hypothetical protein